MIKVAVFFGGASREREVSFAGGRTVYDNLDKSLFEAIPLFVDTAGNFVRLHWEYIYRGSIRDFFPPVSFLPESEHGFQIYSESLDLSAVEYDKMLNSIGVKMSIEEIADEIDFAFLALHGRSGEDGTIQGLLEWHGIPYSGSGLLPSALGVSKHVQKKWWKHELAAKPWFTLNREEWGIADKKALASRLKKELGLPFVVKSSNQGSSIGVQVVSEEDVEGFTRQVNAAFFVEDLDKNTWENTDKVAFIQKISDLRSGLGLPLLLDGREIRHQEQLLRELEQNFKHKNRLRLEALHSEYQVVFEPFLKGREFSCIVIVDDNGVPIALPPTEVVKGQEIFDYNSKYLPGLSHKQTPIQIEAEKIEEIRKACVSLFSYFEFEVYARIDGFITDEGVFLNDPNTTSGMMPSSFFFHQAAEIGLNPKNFITYIIRTSLAERWRKNPGRLRFKQLLENLDESLQKQQDREENKQKVAVLLGGYSTERHISVESGRNIYEKLASSINYEPVPVFLSGEDHHHILHEIPVNIMLKDNADDIRDKVNHPRHSEILEKIREEAAEITRKYTGANCIFDSRQISYEELAANYDAVFIALHGRPGEDGQVQEQLDRLSVAYNGSGVNSSRLTINKYETNRILRENGFLVADNFLISKEDWLHNKEEVLSKIESLTYPLICKPHDEGCSSAVIRIRNRGMLEAYAALCFGLSERGTETEQLLGLKQQDEFPLKNCFMVESLIAKGAAKRFLEITGGMLSYKENGELQYEVFEPSEALSSGAVLSLAEKFLAGEGQNITPARFSADLQEQVKVSTKVREVFAKVAALLGVEGYCRIDAFVRIYDQAEPEVVIIEINSLPGMTPATCIYHQAAINSYKPYQFIDRILQYGMKNKQAFVK